MLAFAPSRIRWAVSRLRRIGWLRRGWVSGHRPRYFPICKGQEVNQYQGAETERNDIQKCKPWRESGLLADEPERNQPNDDHWEEKEEKEHKNVPRLQ